MAEAAYAFSVPSIEDDLALDCRIYHPKDLISGTARPRAAIKGAIVAHPYAPLGGCYDDPVVVSVTKTLRELGFIVATFNFRGAGESQGRTTWSGKAEQGDYVSVVGLMIHYLEQLISDDSILEASDATDKQRLDTNSEDHSGTPSIQLILAGYSYGSLVLARLPSVASIQATFQSATIGSTAAEIILRARTLAKETRKNLEATSSSSRGRSSEPTEVRRPSTPQQRTSASPLTIGGDESPRPHNNANKVPHGVIRRTLESPGKRIKAHIRRSSQNSNISNETTSATLPPTLQKDRPRIVIQPSYLLISPVLVPFTHTLLPPGPPTFAALNLSRMGSASSGETTGAELVKYRTLAVFGSQDGFTSERRLRGWAEEVAGRAEGRMEWERIDGAGHFWREEGAMRGLKRRIKEWVSQGESGS